MHRQIAGKLTGPVTKWIVLLVALVVTKGLASFAAKLADVQDNQTSSWLPASAESTKALDKLEKFQDPYDAGTTLAYYRPSGLTKADFAAIESQAKQIDQLDGVTNVITPGIARASHAPVQTVSADGQVAVVNVTVNYGDQLWKELPDLKKKIDALATSPGGSTYLTGLGGSSADASTVFSSLDGVLIFATLGIVVLILLLTYRSPVLWLLPIFSAGMGLGASMGLVYLLAKYADLTVNGQTQFIMTVLAIGAGTDYALLLIARYREELRRHEDRHEAMAFALHRAAPAILASAATVAVGLLCLLFAELNSTAGMGPANAVAIVVTFVVMVTLLPALLVIFGRWVFWPFIPRFGSEEPTAHGIWAKVGRRIAPRPRTVWVGTALALGLLALGFLRLDTSGVPSDQMYTKTMDSVTGQALLIDHKLADASNPVQVVTSADHARAVATALSHVDGLGTPVVAATKDGTSLVLASLDHDPYSEEAFDTVRAARDAAHAADPGSLVTGTSAVTLDVKNASARDDKVIIPIVLIAVLLILIGLLRALVAPLLLIGTVVLSFGSALGLSSLVFETFFNRDHADPGYPLFAFVFLVALGIDYNIFLMTRVREETIERGTRQGSLVALSSTGGVITAAGIVLAATFAILATMPMTFMLELGMTIALGVLLDTWIVRSVLVTALNLDAGDKIWWPSKLATSRSDSPAALADATI
jgi:RND superfamily putative drug exporter